MSCFDSTHAPVATAARAAGTGLVSMSTRPDIPGMLHLEREARDWSTYNEYSYRIIRLIHPYLRTRVGYVLCTTYIQPGISSYVPGMSWLPRYVYVDTYKDRAAPPIGGTALHDGGVKTVQWTKREGHDSYQEVEVYIYKYIYRQIFVKKLWHCCGVVWGTYIFWQWMWCS